MSVDLIDHMGSDLTVVNAARVSFGKRVNSLTGGDAKLINYLARHGHWTPFAHCQAQFHIKAPIFVARQLAKHQVGLVWNEISRRYVSTSVATWQPPLWRKAAPNKKQGSLQENIDEQGHADDIYGASVNQAALAYRDLILLGVCPEQARAVLPLASYTEWYWTGSLYAFHRIVKLRLSEDAQEETRGIAAGIDRILGEKFPVSWKALMTGGTEENAG